MRSPLRSIPSDRTNRPRPTELAAIKKRRKDLVRNIEYEQECERTRRRQLRLKQVRNQANQNAKVLRDKVRSEQERLFKEIAEEELAKYIRRKEAELASLEDEYHKALADVGMGQDAVRKHEEYLEWKAKRQRQNARKAQVRGQEAMRKLREEKELKDKVKTNKIKLRKSVLLSERLRSAEIRSGNILMDPNKVQVIEVDAAQRSRKVRFEDKDQVVETVEKGKENVRKIVSGPYEKNGVEMAIRSQQFDYEEMLRQNQIEQKWDQYEQDHLFDVQRAPEDFYEYRRNPVVIRSRSSRERSIDDDLDLMPVKEISSSTSASPFRDLEVRPAPVTPAKEMSGPVVVGGPSSAFHEPKSRTKGNLKDATGVKDNRDFIAKVLEDFVEDEDVRIKVNVQEVSSSSSLSVPNASGILESTKITSTTSTSEDLTQERFLNKEWLRHDDRADFTRVRDLIGQLTARNDGKNVAAAATEKGRRQNFDLLLQGYIEKLLEMRRQEIDDLSISDVSSLMTTFSSEKSQLQQSRSSSSILSSSDSKKNVKFQEPELRALKKQEVIEQTTRSLAEVRNYYQQQREIIAQELVRRQQRKILQGGRRPLSEGSLSSSSSSSREKSSEASLIVSESTPSLSPSSSSSLEVSGVKQIYATSKSLATSQSIIVEARQSANQSMDRELRFKEQKKIMRNQFAEFTKSKALAHLNKSSSSGTTTSSSNATAEFLSRLRRMEMPTLKPPGEDFFRKQIGGRETGTTDDLNTSADLLRVKELDSSQKSKSDEITPSFSSLNLSGSHKDIVGKGGDISHLTLSSSSSSSEDQK